MLIGWIFKIICPLEEFRSGHFYYILIHNFYGIHITQYRISVISMSPGYTKMAVYNKPNENIPGSYSHIKHGKR